MDVARPIDVDGNTGSVRNRVLTPVALNIMNVNTSSPRTPKTATPNSSRFLSPPPQSPSSLPSPSRLYTSPRSPLSPRSPSTHSRILSVTPTPTASKFSTHSRFSALSRVSQLENVDLDPRRRRYRLAERSLSQAAKHADAEPSAQEVQIKVLRAAVAQVRERAGEARESAKRLRELLAQRGRGMEVDVSRVDGWEDGWEGEVERWKIQRDVWMEERFADSLRCEIELHTDEQADGRTGKRTRAPTTTTNASGFVRPAPPKPNADEVTVNRNLVLFLNTSFTRRSLRRRRHAHSHPPLLPAYAARRVVKRKVTPLRLSVSKHVVNLRAYNPRHSRDLSATAREKQKEIQKDLRLTPRTLDFLSPGSSVTGDSRTSLSLSGLGFSPSGSVSSLVSDWETKHSPEEHQFGKATIFYYNNHTRSSRVLDTISESSDTPTKTKMPAYAKQLVDDFAEEDENVGLPLDSYDPGSPVTTPRQPSVLYRRNRPVPAGRIPRTEVPQDVSVWDVLSPATTSSWSPSRSPARSPHRSPHRQSILVTKSHSEHPLKQQKKRNPSSLMMLLSRPIEQVWHRRPSQRPATMGSRPTSVVASEMEAPSTPSRVGQKRLSKAGGLQVLDEDGGPFPSGSSSSIPMSTAGSVPSTPKRTPSKLRRKASVGSVSLFSSASTVTASGGAHKKNWSMGLLRSGS